MRSRKKVRPSQGFSTKARLVIMTGAALLVAGCQTPRRSFEPPLHPDGLGDVEFLHYLASLPAVSVDEGSRAVLMASGGTEQWRGFEERVTELRRRGAVDEAQASDPDRVLTMGGLAYTLVPVCDVPPGVNGRISRVTGVGKRRYALRACVDAGLLPYSTPRQLVRGGELVAALIACSERLEARGP